MNYKACNSTNFKKGRISDINYIVIHFTANNGDTAKNNVDYFANNNNLSASAHYFVDENEVWQSVNDGDTAWHCGGSSYKHPFCRNANSIGVEMCSRKDSSGKYYIKEETINNTIELVKTLMVKYNVPIEHVIRHYDVTGKICPAPLVENVDKWAEFKSRLSFPKLESGNDIVWELMNGKHKIEITEVQRAIKAIDNAKNNAEFSPCYWMLYKIVNK